MTGVKQIRLMIVDDHRVVRSGLSAFLLAYDDLKLVGEASNGLEAIRLAEALHPAAILMDLAMPVMDGFEAAQTIKQWIFNHCQNRG